MRIRQAQTALIISTIFALSLTGCGGEDFDITDFAVGELGPAGGFIFFVDEDNDYEFDFLEAAPEDAERDGEGIFQWASGFDESFYIGANGSQIGSGEQNTATIVGALDGDEQTNRAAQVADAYEFDGYDDWFLPSEQELELMYETLKAEDVADFDGMVYWSSTENSVTHATGQSFSSGMQTEWRKDYRYRVRPIRAF